MTPTLSRVTPRLRPPPSQRSSVRALDTTPSSPAMINACTKTHGRTTAIFSWPFAVSGFSTRSIGGVSLNSESCTPPSSLCIQLPSSCLPAPWERACLCPEPVLTKPRGDTSSSAQRSSNARPSIPRTTRRESRRRSTTPPRRLKRLPKRREIWRKRRLTS